MANLGSIPALTLDVDSKVTVNGANENTGLRVNELLNNMVDTITGAPVVSDGTPSAFAIFASAAQGLLADSAVQPADLAAVATSGSYDDLDTTATADGVTITGTGTALDPFVAVPQPSSVLTGNVAYVDAVNGDDGTGAVGDASLPFLTLLAAQTAASAGQTIVVYPGTYAGTDALGKDGVDWYFMPGAEVTFTSDGFVADSEMSYGVYGYGVFTGNSGQVARVAFGGTTSVTINAISISGAAIVVSNGVLNITASVVLPIAGLGAALVSGGTLNINGDITVANATNGILISAGTLTIKNSTFTTSALGSACIRVTGGTTTLDGVVLASAGSTITTLTTATVYCFNVRGVNGPGTGVTIQGNYFGDYLGYIPTAGFVPTMNADGTWSWA